MLLNPVQAAVLDYLESNIRRRITGEVIGEKARAAVREAILETIAEYEANVASLIPTYEVGPVTRTEDGRMRVEIRLHGWPDLQPQAYPELIEQVA